MLHNLENMRTRAERAIAAAWIENHKEQIEEFLERKNKELQFETVERYTAQIERLREGPIGLYWDESIGYLKSCRLTFSRGTTLRLHTRSRRERLAALILGIILSVLLYWLGGHLYRQVRHIKEHSKARQIREALSKRSTAFSQDPCATGER